MNVILVGTGNVAFALGRILTSAHHSVIEVCGRNTAALQKLSLITGAKVNTNPANLSGNADVCLLAVSDSSIAEVAEQIPKENYLVAHTSGATSKEVLQSFENYGVLYPLQSLRKETESVPPIPFFVDGNQSHNIELLQKLAASTGNTVSLADDEKRLKLHAAAVLCSNFVNHLYSLTDFFCRSEKINFKNMLPLIEETAMRLHQFSPAQVQTGPAIRGDEITIARHLQLLKPYPSLENLYQVLTESILQFSKKP